MSQKETKLWHRHVDSSPGRCTRPVAHKGKESKYTHQITVKFQPYDEE